jgi:hypothetical protein
VLFDRYSKGFACPRRQLADGREKGSADERTGRAPDVASCRDGFGGFAVKVSSGDPVAYCIKATRISDICVYQE